MFRPTRRTLLLFGLGAPIAAVPAVAATWLWPLWAGWLGLLALGLGLDGVLVARRRQLTLTVDHQRLMPVGVPTPATITVTTAPAVRAIEVRPATEGMLAPVEGSVLTLTDGRGSLPIELRARRRGHGALVAAWVRWTGPLGLLWNEHRVPLEATVEASPDTRRLREEALRMRARPETRVGQKIEHYLGDGSEFEALREFVVGIDHRAIDWKATARHHNLLCRQYRAERNHQVILAIDTGHRMAEELLGVPRLDHAITQALQLAFACLRSGDQVGLFTFADRPVGFAAPRDGLGALAHLRTACSELDYQLAETNYTVALTDLMRRVRRRSLLVLFTDFTDSITAELMVPSLLRLARRHLVLFVALRDPTLAAATTAAPERLHHVHRAVVAAELARDREVVLERIRRAGVQVVDAEPAAIGTQLINRYLELKRREAV